MHVEPFRIAVPEAVLVDLRERLARTRFPDEMPGSGWTHGTNLAYLRELVAYWRDRYDWRAAEERLNAFPQFRAQVGGLGIHFMHVRGVGPRPLPLVVAHGWPGSVAEFAQILGPLTDPAAHGGDPADAFDVVVPSLPGYGFSERPRERGWGPERIARAWAEIMAGLGYARFGAQGGDWGAAVATWLARHFPDRVAGIHLNYIPGSYVPHVPAGEEPTAEEKAYLSAQDRWRVEKGAYGHIQATRPQTLGFGLNDSPVGPAAWIVEKFREWSECGGEIERRFTKDALLANVTLYWVTQTIASSSRLYAEGRARPLALDPGERIPVPLGVARFAKEEPMPPRSWVERGYNVARWTEFPSGGHFAAMEEPATLAEDVRDFFRPLRGLAP